jgi:hypothetical protein
MTGEAGSVPLRHFLKKPGFRNESISCGFRKRLNAGQDSRCEFRQFAIGLMTDRAIVELGLVVRRLHKRSRHKMGDSRSDLPVHFCNYVLVDVVRKDRRKFLHPRPYRKGKAGNTSRSGAYMAICADGWLIAGKEIAFMACEARCVTREIGNIGITARREPVARRHLVAGSTLQLLMSCGGVRKTRLSFLSGRFREETRRETQRRDCYQ